MNDRAKTYDDGKEPLAQLPWAAIDELARVQAYGQHKYGDFNNYRKGIEVSRNLSCALRHIRDYMNGCDTDHESGLNPLAHAMCRLAFVMQNLHDRVAIDDRYKREVINETTKPIESLDIPESQCGTSNSRRNNGFYYSDCDRVG